MARGQVHDPRLALTKPLGQTTLGARFPLPKRSRGHTAQDERAHGAVGAPAGERREGRGAVGWPGTDVMERQTQTDKETHREAKRRTERELREKLSN